MISTSLSALNAFATGVQGVAHNIANIHTDGFHPVSVRYQSGPGDQGVSPVVTRPLPFDTPPRALTADRAGDPADRAASLSGVEPAREMTNLIAHQRSFEANAAVIRTSDDLLGTLLDLRV